MDTNAPNTPGKLLQKDQRLGDQQGDTQVSTSTPQPPTRKRSRVSKAAAANAVAGASAATASTTPAGAVVGAPIATGGNGAPAGAEGVTSADTSGMPPPPTKKSRTNTPWTPQEEQRLKAMRDAGNSWNEIAKTFPTRTEGSVKKHWYKDMHYAEFGEDESAALLAAIREYENNKWKVVGQKVGKPAKACEAYAKEHFGGKA